MVRMIRDLRFGICFDDCVLEATMRPCPSRGKRLNCSALFHHGAVKRARRGPNPFPMLAQRWRLARLAAAFLSGASAVDKTS